MIAIDTLEKRLAFGKLEESLQVLAVLGIHEIENGKKEGYNGLNYGQIAEQIAKNHIYLNKEKSLEKAETGSKRALELGYVHYAHPEETDKGWIYYYKPNTYSETKTFYKELLQRIGFLETNETLTLP